MDSRMKTTLHALVAAALLLSSGCDKQPAAPAAAPAVATADKGAAPATAAAPKAPAIKTDKGVDLATKTIKIGMLNAESGPAAPIGKPFALGKRIMAAQVNAGGVLPEGWKIELVERDHGYNPQKSVQYYSEIKDDILFIGNSFGTPPTLPLRSHLKRDNTIAFPASLSSQMAEFAHTPPLGPGYLLEAKRAMDWAVESSGGAANVKAGVVYQQDDYGKDGLAGWQAAAKHHGVSIVSEQAVSRGQKDFSAIVTALKEAGATHVLMCVLPSATGPIVGTAAKLGFGPKWIGNTPSWLDAFFNPKVIPGAVFANYHWVQSAPFWGEDLKGMKAFLDAFKAHGGGGNPDFYVLTSYIQGQVMVEALNRAIASGDLSRAGFMKAVQSIDGYDAGGMIQPIALTKVPYVTGTKTRILKPDMANKTWTVVAPYAAPKS
jgi:ABC-type branched-subunit amino acid transport system substrate-binding protein